jgi:hypothetical protein
VSAIVCVGASFWIGSEASNSVCSAANLEGEFSRKRDGLTAAQKPDNVTLTEALVGELKQGFCSYTPAKKGARALHL